MGDRTYVEITIRRKDYDELLKKLNLSEEEFENEIYCEDVSKSTHTISFGASEINYANWDELEQILADNDIEFNKNWDAGGTYSGGESYRRIIDGEWKEFEVHHSDEGLISFLKLIMNLEPDKIKEEVQRVYKEIYPFEPTEL